MLWPFINSSWAAAVGFGLLTNAAVTWFAVESSRDSVSPLLFRAANRGVKPEEAAAVCVCEGEKTGPFSCCFSIGCCWSRPVPCWFKTKWALTSHTHTPTLSLYHLDKAGTPSFHLLFLLFPPFCFWRGDDRLGPCPRSIWKKEREKKANISSLFFV